MSDLFTSYQQQFITTLTTITKKIQSIAVQTNQKKELAFVDIKEDQRQCEKLLRLMETEIGSFEVQVKLEFAKKVRQYKKDMDDCKKRLYRAQQDYALEKNKQMLMGAQLDQQKSHPNKQKLIKQGQLMSDTNYKLKDSVKVMHETLDLSNNIQIELTNQSQKMKANKQNLIEMQGDIDSSYRKIGNIFMRIRRNKLTLVGSIGVVVVIVVIALVVHFSKK